MFLGGVMKIELRFGSGPREEGLIKFFKLKKYDFFIDNKL